VRQPSWGGADRVLGQSIVTFRERPDEELHQLDDDELVAYGRAARDAGNLAAARRALAFLVYGYEADVHRRVTLRVPSHAADEVTRDVLVRAVASAFDGRSVGQFRSWINTIIGRAAADYFRTAARRPKEAPLPGEHDEDAVWGRVPSVESDTGEVELRLLVDDILESFNDTHRMVIDLHVFDGYTAREVCDRIDGMAEDNVAKIASRFRARLRERLEEST
jgi:RNA polymerase sigma factor (sigma-70 family)